MHMQVTRSMYACRCIYAVTASHLSLFQAWLPDFCGRKGESGNLTGANQLQHTQTDKHGQGQGLIRARNGKCGHFDTNEVRDWSCRVKWRSLERRGGGQAEERPICEKQKMLLLLSCWALLTNQVYSGWQRIGTFHCKQVTYTEGRGQKWRRAR